MTDAEATSRIEYLTEVLRANGFRLTHQRLEVVRELAATDAHPDAEHVFRSVRKRVPTISLDTVYRTLGTLADLGLVSRFVGASGAVRYDPNLSQHHHFVCTGCGRIYDVENPDLDHVTAPDALVKIGQVEHVEVRFRGVCHECAEQLR